MSFACRCLTLYTNRRLLYFNKSLSSLRLKSSQTNVNENVNDTNDYESHRSETKFTIPKSIEPEPIKSLELMSKIKRVVKYDSFMGNLFIGKYDCDFLAWPMMIKSRDEYLMMKQQYDMIQQSWSKIDKSESTLNLLGFNKLFMLTVSEMINVFEAIGGSTLKKLNFSHFQQFNDNSKLFVNINNNNNRVMNDHSVVNVLDNDKRNVNDNDVYESIPQTLISMIIHNAICGKAIQLSSNTKIIDMIMKREKYPKIGFAFCESQENLGSLPYTQWNSVAKITNDLNSWVINGSKTKIFHDDYDYYLIFCRTSDVSERRKRPEFNEKQIKDDSIVGLLVSKNLVNVQSDGTDNFGLRYQKITFSDLLLSREDCEVFEPEEKAVMPLNIKGIGQIATASIILGMLKESLKKTYKYLIDEKIGIIDCEIIHQKLMRVTQRIYSLESSLYLTSAMFDAFEPGTDCSLEAITVKTIATQMAHESVHDLRSIYSSRYLRSSDIHDLINLFDSFLDCSVNNRMYLALRGVRIFGQWRHDHVRRVRLGPIYPVYNIKTYIKALRNRRDNIRLDLQLNGYLHHSLKKASDWLEYSVKRLEYATEILLFRHGKDIIKKQMDLDRLANMAMECYVMTAVLSRSSNAFCQGYKHGDWELEFASAICSDAFLRVRNHMDEITGQFDISTDYVAKHVHSRNMKSDGYFPSSPFDSLI